MISAAFYRLEDKKLRLCVNGHAPKGRSDVCAAASALLCSLTGYLFNRYGKKLSVNALEAGHADVECPEENKELLKMVCIGFLMLSEQYPGSVEVKTDIWFTRLCAPIKQMKG